MIVHVARAGEIVGEFDEPTFQEKIFAGEIRSEDHYWAEGFADWKSVSQYRIAAKTVRMSVAPPELERPQVRGDTAALNDKLCANCGYVGRPRTAGFWALFARAATCPECGGQNMIPVSSLVAQHFLAQR